MFAVSGPSRRRSRGHLVSPTELETFNSQVMFLCEQMLLATELSLSPWSVVL